MRSLVATGLLALVACGSGAGTGDAVLERLCEIHMDIVNDAADGVDTLAETRERYRDLLEGYGSAVGGPPEQTLREVVSALTTGRTRRLEEALLRLTSICEEAIRT